MANKFIHKIIRSKRIISLIIVWALIILGVTLRGFKADIYPTDNNDDGLFYAWAGISFWDNPLRPITHSIFDNNNPALVWRSQFRDFIPLERFGLKLVEPWLDHPPLGAAIIGLPARLLGYRGFEPIPQMIVRLPALIASIFTLFLTYLLGKKLFGEKVGRLSLLFLATVPYYVISQRQSFLENILTPVVLAALIFLHESKLLPALILAFFCGWIKVPGFAVPLMIAVWLLQKKQLKAAMAFVGTGILSVVTYLIYGFAADRNAFLFILTNQADRGAFVNSVFDAITKPHFYGGFNDGWYVLGFIFSFLMLTKFKKESFKFFNWFLSMWLLLLFLIAGRYNNSPWYWFPLIPFFSISLGYFANLLLKKHHLFLVLPFWLLGLTGFDLLKINLNPNYLRLATIFFFIPFGLNLKKITVWLTRLLLIALVCLNIYVILRYPTIHCREEECLAPTKIILNYE
ncbi:MAG: glycosyltransferase family 39 protein [Candidatus Beckwithbacteria bacterium]|nr:glycosyltransferase family 39 protein [Candidatus Beckwithbacteria bacterium]